MADGAGLSPEIKAQFDALQNRLGEMRSTAEEIAKKGDAVLETKLANLTTDFEGLKASVNTAVANLQRGGAGGEDEVSFDTKAAVVRAIERKAFDLFVRTGNPRAILDDVDAVKAATDIGMETKTLSTIIAADGGYATTPEMLADFVEINLETSPMRQIARVQQIGTGNAKLPVRRKGANAAWTTELASRTATNTPILSMQEFAAHEIYALPLLTNAIAEDGEFDIEGWLEDDVTEAFEIAENLAFVTGSGTGKPKGFTTYTKTAVASYDANTSYGTHSFRGTGVSGGFATTPDGADALVKLVYDFKPVYRGALDWTMNRATLAAVRVLKDSNGQYLVRTDLSATNGIIDRLLGYPVHEFEDMDDIAANAYAIALGDFNRGYLIVDRVGMQMRRDETKYPGFIEFQFRRRVGGDCRDFDAIKFLKFA